MAVPRISIDELHRRIEKGEHVVLLDTRSPDAWEQSDVELPGAIRVPADEVDQHLREIPRDRMVVTYCT
jgi:rhodanese-related sulfurtransferase